MVETTYRPDNTLKMTKLPEHGEITIHARVKVHWISLRRFITALGRELSERAFIRATSENKTATKTAAQINEF